MFKSILRRKLLLMWLSLSCLLSVGLAFTRIYYTSSITLGFMLWNLGLAVVPMFAAFFVESASEKKVQLKLWLGIAAWLLFFPNAPYMITDLFHLRPRISVPVWYDLFLLISFAWNGLLIAYISLFIVHEKVRKIYGFTFSWAFSVICLFLSAFGVYLGRYMRWNSWDILTKPQPLLLDVADRIIHPFQHTHTWGVTLLFGVFMIFGYAMIRQLSSLKIDSKPHGPL